MNSMKMNRISTTLFVLALIAIVAFAGCRQNVTPPENMPDTSADIPFEFSLKADSCYFVITDIYKMGLENKYSVQWPAEGMLAPEAERELLVALFGDSTATSFDEAASRWVKTNGYVESFGIEQGDMEVRGCQVDSKPDVPDELLCYDYVNCKIEENGNLLEFYIFSENYMGGAHGVHYFQSLVYDRDAARMIRLADLVDTTDFGEVVARAIEDLSANETVRECLFDEELLGDQFPVSTNFYIDSTRSTITLIYQIYEITPYACGTQEVVMPIFWLSKHRELTPYAKDIFGEGCSL